jgi:hypothetical protein
MYVQLFLDGIEEFVKLGPEHSQRVRQLLGQDSVYARSIIQIEAQQVMQSMVWRLRHKSDHAASMEQALNRDDAFWLPRRDSWSSAGFVKAAAGMEGEEEEEDVEDVAAAAAAGGTEGLDSFWGDAIKTIVDRIREEDIRFSPAAIFVHLAREIELQIDESIDVLTKQSQSHSHSHSHSQSQSQSQSQSHSVPDTMSASFFMPPYPARPDPALRNFVNELIEAETRTMDTLKYSTATLTLQGSTPTTIPGQPSLTLQGSTPTTIPDQPSLTLQGPTPTTIPGQPSPTLQGSTPTTIPVQPLPLTTVTTSFAQPTTTTTSAAVATATPGKTAPLPDELRGLMEGVKLESRSPVDTVMKLARAKD